MILLADGGSTKVDWRLVENGKEISRLQTRGINPYFRTGNDIKQELKDSLLPLLEENIPESIWFYGAGCTHKEVNDIIRFALYDSTGCKEVEIYSDLWGAARGLCGTQAGIACILGTGSNSCYYDGTQIISNVSPLGYILGDEGSGAVLGKLFIGACLKNRLTAGLKDQFLSEYELTPAMILEKVYKQPNPNRFLAGFAPFILKHIENTSVYDLVRNAFHEFFLRNVTQYNYKDHPVHLTGSIAFYFRDIVKEVAAEFDIIPGQIISSPMEGLIRYHS